MTLSMASRVVPASSLTMVRVSPAMALNSDDLPALGRPTMATGVSAGVGLRLAVVEHRRRQTSTRRSEQLAAAGAVQRRRPAAARRGRARRSPARSAVLAGSSILLATTTTGDLGAAQHVGDRVVVGQRAGAAVDHEEDDVGRGDARARPARGCGRRTGRPSVVS